MDVSIDPVFVNEPTSHVMWPSIKIHESAPIVALRERILRMTALIGKITEPVYKKSKIRTLSAIQPSAHGKVLEIPFCVSAYSAAVPPTYVLREVGIARTTLICFCVESMRVDLHHEVHG